MRRFGLVTLLFVAACSSEDAELLGAGFYLTPEVIDFGTIDIGTQVTERVIVRSRLDENLPLEIRTTDDTPSSFTVSRESLTVGPRANTFFDVSFEPRSVENFVGRVEVTDGADVQTVQLLGRVPKTDCLTVRPSEVEFGNVVIGTSVTRELTLENGCEEPIRVTFEYALGVTRCADRASVFCFPDDTIDLDAGATVRTELRFRPDRIGSRSRATLTLAACETPACERVVELRGLGIETGFLCERLDFGAVSPGTCVTRSVRCANDANLAVSLSGWRLLDGFPFEVEPSELRRVEPGAEIGIDVTYCPRRPREDNTTLQIDTDHPDPLRARVPVPIQGLGGGPDPLVHPDGCVDFGLVSTRSSARRHVLVTNVGFSELALTAIVGDTEQTGAYTTPGATPTTVDPGAALSIDVEFAPPTAGLIESKLLILTNDADEPRIEVCLRGEGVALPACNFELDPPTIDFGDVEIGRTTRRWVTVHNRGSQDCLVSGVRMVPGSDWAYSTTDVRSHLIAAGEALDVEVVLRPDRPSGTRTGALEIALSDPQRPRNQVELRGVANDTAPFVAPTVTDFGAIDTTCDPGTRSVRFYNHTPVPSTVETIDFSRTGFTIANAPALPVVVPPDGSISVDVAFDGSVSGDHPAALRFAGNLDRRPFTTVTTVRGRRARDARQVDEFDDVGNGAVDVLLVVDNTTGPDEERAALAERFDLFSSYATDNAIDYHVAVTTMSTRPDYGQGRLVHNDMPMSGDLFDGPRANRIVTAASTPSPGDVFATNVNMRGASLGAAFDTAGFTTMRLATSPAYTVAANAGFLRPEARLSVLFVSDEEERSVESVAFFEDMLDGVKGTSQRHRVTASALAGPTPAGCSGAQGTAIAAPRYADFVRRTGGTFASICSADWDATVRELGDTVFGFGRRYRLTAPALAQTIEVEIDGIAVPRVGPSGAILWTYDASDGAIELSPLVPLMPGSTVRVRYSAQCA